MSRVSFSSSIWLPKKKKTLRKERQNVFLNFDSVSSVALELPVNSMSRRDRNTWVVLQVLFSQVSLQMNQDWNHKEGISNFFFSTFKSPSHQWIVLQETSGQQDKATESLSWCRHLCLNPWLAKNKAVGRIILLQKRKTNSERHGFSSKVIEETKTWLDNRRTRATIRKNNIIP